MGVLLFVDAQTDLYFGLNAINDLDPAPLGLQANFLQMGVSAGSGYVASLGRVYHENNTFYLPLRQEQTHTIQWELSDSQPDAKIASFKVVCLGHVE